MPEFCYMNHSYIPKSETMIPIGDLAIQRAYAVFDYFKFDRGTFPFFDDHYHRLINSANLCELTIPFQKNEIYKISKELVRMSQLQNPAIKIILSAGKNNDANLIICAEECPTYPEIYYHDGIRLITHAYQRETPEIKSTNYLYSLVIEKKLKIKSNELLLYFNNNSVTECARCNFFGVKGKKLITPKDGILHGITRKRVLEMTKSEDIEIRDIPIHELGLLDEAFITSTSRGIMPVTKIDNTTLSNGKIGNITREIQRKIKHGDSL